MHDGQIPPIPRNEIERLILRAAARFGIDSARFLRTARCESGLNPRALSPSGRYAGLFQHARPYWPARARQAGMPGADVFDAWSNAYVSAWLWNDSGPGHWKICAYR